MGRYQKGKTSLDFTAVRDSEWQWPLASLHLAPDRQPCQHPTTQFLQARCPSCRPTNSVRALKAWQAQKTVKNFQRSVRGGYYTAPSYEGHSKSYLPDHLTITLAFCFWHSNPNPDPRRTSFVTRLFCLHLRQLILWSPTTKLLVSD